MRRTLLLFGWLLLAVTAYGQTVSDASFTNQTPNTTGGGGPSTYAGSASAAGPATTALAWENNPAACAASRCVTDQNADGSLVCSQPAFSWLTGAATDAQIPNDITIDLATSCTTALAGDSATLFFSAGVCEVARGCTGTGSTLTGLVRGSASAFTAAELSGDATTSGSNAVTVAKVNGVSYAASPSTDTVPTITAASTATYKALTDCDDTAGQHVNYDTTTHAWSCGTSSSATGNVVGPSSATDECFARFDTTTGKLVQNSVVCATDAGAIITPATMQVQATNSVTSLRFGGSGSGNFGFGLNSSGQFSVLAGDASAFKSLAASDFIANSFLYANSAYFGGLTAAQAEVHVNGSAFYLGSGYRLGWGSNSIPDTGGYVLDIGLSRAAAKVLSRDTATSGDRLGWEVGGNTCVVATDQTNATTTPQTWACYVTGTTPIALAAGRRYAMHCVAFLSDSTSVDGASVDFDAGTATATAFHQHTTASDTTGFILTTNQDTTALATDVSAGTFTSAGSFTINGYIRVNAAGTWQPRFMQVGHTAGTLTLGEGSNCIFDDVTP